MVTAQYLLTVIMVAFGSSMQFYSYSVVNPSQKIVSQWINETFRIRFNDRPMTIIELNFYWSIFVSSIAVGAMFGSMFTSRLAESVGRRNGLLLNGVTNILGGLFEGIAKSLCLPELLILGRFILGINIGLSSGLAPMYLMEITSIQYRGAAGSIHQVASVFSDCISLLITLPSILGNEHFWPIAFALPFLPALLMCIILPFSPESPQYTLITLGDRHQAYKAVRTFVGDSQAPAVFDSLIKEAALNNRKSQKTGFFDLFRLKSLRTPLIISIVVMIAQQFTGCSIMFAYSTEMFLKADINLHWAQLSTFCIGIIYFFCTCPSLYLIERLGRRFLSLFQLSGCLLSLIMMSFFTWLQNDFDQHWASYASVFFGVVHVCVRSRLLSSMVW